MPAKASGTSMGKFTMECMDGGENNIFDHFIRGSVKGSDFLTDSLRLPKVITAHIYNDEAMMNLLQQTTKKRS